MTRVAVLTPPGTGAIATVAVVGPRAWAVVRKAFRPAKGELPEAPPTNRFWLGRLGDEVVVAATEAGVEVHCHGGRRVVRLVVDQLVQFGCEEVSWEQLESGKPTPRGGWACDPRALSPLTQAPTLRTASILLDQYHGAFARALDDLANLDRLAALAELGRHLVNPWKVVVAGAPNVGKSSLVNALAGYQRAVVAPVAGTTRDVVTVTVALDGWPVELSDTAGLRAATDVIEAEGIARARQQVADADLVVWVLDATDSQTVWPGDGDHLVVVNKTDAPHAWDITEDHNVIPVSATTGVGVPDLATAIIQKLVPAPPAAGEAVPFTPALADAVVAARNLVRAGNVVAARETLAALRP